MVSEVSGFSGYKPGNTGNMSYRIERNPFGEGVRIVGNGFVFAKGKSLSDRIVNIEKRRSYMPNGGVYPIDDARNPRSLTSSEAREFWKLWKTTCRSSSENKGSEAVAGTPLAEHQVVRGKTGNGKARRVESVYRSADVYNRGGKTKEGGLGEKVDVAA